MYFLFCIFCYKIKGDFNWTEARKIISHLIKIIFTNIQKVGLQRIKYVYDMHNVSLHTYVHFHTCAFVRSCRKLAEPPKIGHLRRLYLFLRKTMQLVLKLVVQKAVFDCYTVPPKRIFNFSFVVWLEESVWTWKLPYIHCILSLQLPF